MVPAVELVVWLLAVGCIHAGGRVLWVCLTTQRSGKAGTQPLTRLAAGHALGQVNLVPRTC